MSAVFPISEIGVHLKKWINLFLIPKGRLRFWEGYVFAEITFLHFNP